MSIDIGYVKSDLLKSGDLNALTRPYNFFEILLDWKRGYNIAIKYTFWKHSYFNTKTGLEYVRAGYIEKRCHSPQWVDDCFPKSYDNIAKTTLGYLSVPLTASFNYPITSYIKPKISTGIHVSLLAHRDNPLIYPDLVNLDERIDPDDVNFDPEKVASYSRSYISDSLSTLSAGFTFGAGMKILTIHNVDIGVDITYTQDFTNNYQGPADIRLRKRSLHMGIDVSF